MSGTNTFKVILASDPAIDVTASDMSKYVGERDVSALVFDDGAYPVVYHCRPLTLRERREVRNKASDGDRYEAAFVRGLVTVENVIRPDGRRVDFSTDMLSDKSGKSKPIPDSALESYFDEVAIQEVGMVIWFRSFLAQSSRAYYPLPDISRHALTASLYHRAARMSATAPSETNSESPEAPSAQTTSEAEKS